MPDFSLCRNEKCTLAPTCKRQNTKPSEYWQSYTEFKQQEDGTCNNFKKIEDENTNE